MRLNYLLLLAIAPLFCFDTIAQTSLAVPANIKATYDKGTRSYDGKPGKSYWQNTADYDLKINFDPVSRLLSGSEEIDYTNNSPDTLRSIVFKLYPNLYKKGSIKDVPIKPQDLSEGVKISSFNINNEKIDSNPDKNQRNKYDHPGTPHFAKTNGTFQY